MKIKLSLSQFKKVLKTEPVKFPTSFKGYDFTENELNDLLFLLQTAKRTKNRL
jgi:hypothetical protein